jgi:hypothetical protein
LQDDRNLLLEKITNSDGVICHQLGVRITSRLKLACSY